MKKISGPVYGKLCVKGTQLCNEEGNPVQLRGISSHEYKAFTQFMNPEAIQRLIKEWRCDVIRLSVIEDPRQNGYVVDKSILPQLKESINAVIECNAYVIIDWHVLYTGNPNVYKEEAKEFFKTIGDAYPDCDNIIYEICNEPNGEENTWQKEIKKYAAEMVPFIREFAPDNIILIGTGTWAQDIHDAAADPVEGDNLMYVCHFYAFSHKKWLRMRILSCLDGSFGHAIPIFISEWGTTDAQGNLNYDEPEAEKWLNFLDKRNLSWCNWSFCDKDEGSAILKPGTDPKGPWGDEDLRPSGLFVKKRLTAGR